MRSKNLHAIFILILAPFFAFSQSSTASATLDIGTVTTIVHADGSISRTKLKANNKTINYATDLWLGATDSNGQLCFAAQMYSQYGVDYVPGPISNAPNAYAKWNKVWKINQTTVDSFTLGYFQGIVPPSILNWPAHGDTNHGESFYLAPFFDINGDGVYNPVYGDHPCFPGDQAIFFMFNEDTIHGNAETPSMGVEVLGLAYSYLSSPTSPFLDSVVFVNYNIRNRSQNLTNFRAGIFSDFDLGNPVNDIFGSDVNNNAAIVYNTTAEDSIGFGMGPDPVTAGIIIRTGLRADKGDGLDNDKDGCIDGLRDAFGNCIPESDTGNKHEYWRMSSHTYFTNGSSLNYQQKPDSPAEYHNILAGLWKDGTPMTIENPSGFLNPANGDGYDTTLTSVVTKFAFPGNTFQSSGSFEPLTPTNWFMSPNLALDARSIIGAGQSNTFNMGEERQVKIAFFIAQDSTLQNIDAAQNIIESVVNFDEDPPICQNNTIFSVDEFTPASLNISPVPASDFVMISIPERKNEKVLVYNSLGAMVEKITLDENGMQKLNVLTYPAGIYFFHIGQQVAKFVVAR